MARAERRAQLMTTAEYLNTPESALPTELVYGAMRVADAPTPHHQAAVLDFAVALDAHVRAQGIGEIWLAPLDVILDAERALVVQPDLLFISNERERIITDRVRGAPDMVLEVLSPFARVGDLQQRLGWFAYYGVRECWVLHLYQRRLEIVSCGDGAIIRRTPFHVADPIQSAVLPAFSRPLASILRRR
jgi:Uma2 family endonuclease